jgi:dihydroneopterin aldolase
MASAVGTLARTGVDYVKVGLFPAPRRVNCISALSSLAREIKLVGVMFADHGADAALLPIMANAGFGGAMLDTAHKGAGRLIEHRDISALKDFVAICRTHGLWAGLAGALEAPDVPRLLLLEPDYLGFRGALCVRRDRTAKLDPEAFDIIREMIPLDARSAAHDPSVVTVDYRVLAARGYSVDSAREPDAADRIFVRDFILPVRIGAYAREQEKPQNVRFNVEARVLRPGHGAHDMRDVFSYDVIIDGIRIIVGREHIPLVETLAERIAALVLAHPRVIAVKVRVEKLDVGPGGVGVEITREREPEMAKVHHLFPSAAAMKSKAAE